MNNEWTLPEVRRLREMAADGFSASEIAEEIGRPTGGVRHICRTLGIKTRASSNKRDAAGKTDFDRDSRLGSQVLLQACIDMFARTANERGILLDEAMTLHLGTHYRPVIPGCERAIRGQFAERRLAA